MNTSAVAGQVSSRPTFYKIAKNIRYYNFLYVVLFLCIAYYLVFKIFPIINTARLSLCDFSLVSKPSFVGLENFKTIFGISDFWRAYRNTFFLNILNVIFALPAPIIVSLLIFELTGKLFKKVVQTVIVLPHFVSWVIISGIFIQLLSPYGGPVNEIMKALGMEPVYFFGDNRVYRGVLVVSGIWKECGYSTLIYLAAISSIETEMYESAILDGANRLQQIWHITLPSIKETVFTVYMLTLSLGFFASEQTFVMNNSMVYESGDVLGTFSYRIGLKEFNFPVSSAISFCSSFTAFALFMVCNSISKKAFDRKLL